MANKRDFGDVRMADVAARAGVSVITVSRALRSPKVVSDRTRQKIDAAVRELGYVPNGLAAGLSSRRSDHVAVLIPNISNALHSAMVQGLSEVLHEARIQLMVATVGQSQALEEEVLSVCLRHRPCGVVLYQTRHSAQTLEMLRNARIPVVEVGDLIDDPIGTVVSYSNFKAGQAITRELAWRGAREIAMVVPEVSENAAQRYEGHALAMAELGLPHGPHRRFACAPDFDHGAEAVVRIMENDPKIDTVLFSNLAAAIGAWFECERRGWRQPRLTIASFDDPELTGWRGPNLIVARLPRYEVGRQSGQVILQRLNGEKPTSSRIDMGFRIVVH